MGGLGLLSNGCSFMWAMRISTWGTKVCVKFALAPASHGYILGVHMNEQTFLTNNVIGGTLDNAICL